MKHLSFFTALYISNETINTYPKETFSYVVFRLLFCGSNKCSVLFRHLHRRSPFDELNLYSNNESLFNEGKTSITIDPVVFT